MREAFQTKKNTKLWTVSKQGSSKKSGFKTFLVLVLRSRGGGVIVYHGFVYNVGCRLWTIGAPSPPHTQSKKVKRKLLNKYLIQKYWDMNQKSLRTWSLLGTKWRTLCVRWTVTDTLYNVSVRMESVDKQILVLDLYFVSFQHSPVVFTRHSLQGTADLLGIWELAGLWLKQFGRSGQFVLIAKQKQPKTWESSYLELAQNTLPYLRGDAGMLDKPQLLRQFSHKKTNAKHLYTQFD